MFRLGEELAHTREPGKHPALDRTERLTQPVRQLALREAAVVRELQSFALLIGKTAQSVLDTGAPKS